ncbi:IscS subfamily cysteine desulfurase [Fictibacillus nanhaiensis]|uniref:IscS subfamily cysteine desulfurase n=1 Tax=Fictibacillus nanhaiensis TaxID=742169 RepID=A0ABS2ZVS2_9BACL|nr:IscS subfamily cysteine desulfurase [Fictibacillus nanhaiensis]
MIYLDNAATTPLSDSALNAFAQTSKTYFQNTESLHEGGLAARDLLEHARRSLAESLGKESEGIYFTGGGSDGNFLAITSLAHGANDKGKHIISSNIEHPSVDYALRFLENNGYEITRIPVQKNGKVSINTLLSSIRPDTTLVTIQHVNSETGIVQNIKEISERLKEHDVLFHSDCVQSFGKWDNRYFRSMSIDAFTMSAHKIHGPKGTGAVYISPSVHIAPLLSEVTHERGFRAGTVDLPSIVAFVTAAEEAFHLQHKHYQHAVDMRKQFISSILTDKSIVFEGHDDSSPFIIPIRVKGMEGQIVMQELDRLKIAVSTGSACKNGQQAPSKTLLALGRTESEAHELVRISTSHQTTSKEIVLLGKALIKITNIFRSVSEGITR